MVETFASMTDVPCLSKRVLPLIEYLHTSEVCSLPSSFLHADTAFASGSPLFANAMTKPSRKYHPVNEKNYNTGVEKIVSV